MLVSPSLAVFASGRGGVPRVSPAASTVQQLGGTVPGRAAEYGIRLTPASAAEPGTRCRGGGCRSAGMSDNSEGIVSLPVPSPPGGGPHCEEVLGRRGADAGARSLLPDLTVPPPGTLWAEDGAAGGPGIAARAKGGGRRTAVTYVINEASQGPLLAAESGALQSLREACEVVGAALETLHFGKLDFGETAVLDRFYNADIAVVEMSDAFRQPSLFYHLGVRESFSMANNIILYCDTNAESLQSLKEIICQKNNVSMISGCWLNSRHSKLLYHLMLFIFCFSLESCNTLLLYFTELGAEFWKS